MFRWQGASQSSRQVNKLAQSSGARREERRGATHAEVQPGRRSVLNIKKGRGGGNTEEPARFLSSCWFLAFVLFFNKVKASGASGATLLPCQPQLVGGMGRGEAASCADVSSLLSGNCYLETIRGQRPRSEERGSGSTLKEAPLCAGCCAMEIKTRLRATLMLMWILQGKPINSLDGE